MNAQKTLSISVVTNLAGASGRDHLSGIFRYLDATGRPWRLKILNDTDELAAALRRREKPDGIITITPHDGGATLAAVAAADIPCSVTDYPQPLPRGARARTSFIHLDDEEIGRAAVRHFFSRGTFNSFVFFLDEPAFRYADARRRGFESALRALGRRVLVFEPPAPDADAHAAEALNLRFSRLPRPIAVFAARDRAAWKALDICQALNIAVPENAAVLGVDNDELLCNAPKPTLSSILPDHAQAGFLAARELDRLLRGRRGTDVTVTQTIKTLVMRDSTRIVPPAGRLVAEALAFIEKNASGRLHVRDVVAHLGCSRRLADLRFRQVRGESILDAIVRARLGAAKKRLFATNDPVSRVAADCGFSSHAVFTRFFTRAAGRAPDAWRTASRAIPNPVLRTAKNIPAIPDALDAP